MVPTPQQINTTKASDGSPGAESSVCRAQQEAKLAKQAHARSAVRDAALPPPPPPREEVFFFDQVRTHPALHRAMHKLFCKQACYL